ncbi:MAG: hypothetical protein ACLFTB_03500 [Desulfovibrionales bacterium]
MKRNIIVTFVLVFMMAIAGQAWSMGGNNESPEQEPMTGTEQESPGYGQEQPMGGTDQEEWQEQEPGMQQEEYQQEMGGTTDQNGTYGSDQQYGTDQEGQEMGGQPGESQ